MLKRLVFFFFLFFIFLLLLFLKFFFLCQLFTIRNQPNSRQLRKNLSSPGYIQILLLIVPLPPLNINPINNHTITPLLNIFKRFKSPIPISINININHLHPYLDLIIINFLPPRIVKQNRSHKILRILKIFKPKPLRIQPTSNPIFEILYPFLQISHKKRQRFLRTIANRFPLQRHHLLHNFFNHNLILFLHLLKSKKRILQILQTIPNSTYQNIQFMNLLLQNPINILLKINLILQIKLFRFNLLRNIIQKPYNIIQNPLIIRFSCTTKANKLEIHLKLLAILLPQYNFHIIRKPMQLSRSKIRQPINKTHILSIILQQRIHINLRITNKLITTLPQNPRIKIVPQKTLQQRKIVLIRNIPPIMKFPNQVMENLKLRILIRITLQNHLNFLQTDQKIFIRKLLRVIPPKNSILPSLLDHTMEKTQTKNQFLKALNILTIINLHIVKILINLQQSILQFFLMFQRNLHTSIQNLYRKIRKRLRSQEQPKPFIKSFIPHTSVNLVQSTHPERSHITVLKHHPFAILHAFLYNAFRSFSLPLSQRYYTSIILHIVLLN